MGVRVEGAHLGRQRLGVELEHGLAHLCGALFVVEFAPLGWRLLLEATAVDAFQQRGLVFRFDLDLTGVRGHLVATTLQDSILGFAELLL